MSYTLKQIKETAEAAHEAGDVEAVEQLRAIYEQMEQEQVETERVKKDAFTSYTPSTDSFSGQIQQGAISAAEGLGEIGSKLGGDLGELGGQFVQNRLDPMATEQPSEGPESLKQLTGYALSEAVIPAFGEIVIQGFKTFGDAASAVTPNFIEQPVVEAAREAYYDAIHSDTGEMLIEGLAAVAEGPEWYRNWKQDQSPEVVRDLESTINLAAFFTPTPKTEKTDTNLIEDAGAKVTASGRAKINKKRRSDIQVMLNPVDEKQGLGGQYDMPDSKTRAYTPSDHEIEVADEVHKIPEINKSTPFLTMRGHIEKAQEKLRVHTAKRIDELGNPKIDSTDLVEELETSMDELFSGTEFKAVGGNQNVGPPLVEWLREAILKSDGTATGILQVRRDFDSFMKRVSKGALDPQSANPRAMVATKLRTLLNDKVAESAPDAKVKESLGRQSKLYNALDLIEPKHEKQSLTTLYRLQKRIQAIGLSIPHTPVGIVTTLSIAGSMASKAWFPPAAFGLAAVGATGLAYQFIRSGKGRIMIGETIKLTGKLIRKTTDPILKNQYKADRAVLLAYLSDQQEQDKQAKKQKQEGK